MNNYSEKFGEYIREGEKAASNTNARATVNRLMKTVIARTLYEVLIAESISPVGFKTSKGCRVVSGSRDDPYSGRTITDATKLDIDHMVPLKEAHQSGAANWSRERKRAYANDLGV